MLNVAIRKVHVRLLAEDTTRTYAVLSLTNRAETYLSRVIPHAFGRRRPVPIETTDLLKRELDLVESLGEMETTQKINVSVLPKDGAGIPINPLDSKLASLDLQSIEVVDPKSSEFKRLVKYANDTNAGMDQFNTNKNMNVLNAYRIERVGEAKRYMDGKWDKAGAGERLVSTALILCPDAAVMAEFGW